MTEFDQLMETKLLDLVKYILAFSLEKDDSITADPWTPWPFP